MLRKFGMHLAGYNTVHNPHDSSFSLLKTSLFSETATIHYPTHMSNPPFAAAAKNCELPRYLATSCTHCLQRPYSRHLLFCGTDKWCRSLPVFRVCLLSVSGHYIPLHYQGTQNKSHMNAS